MTHSLREIAMLASTASGLPGGSPTPVQLNIPQDAPEVAVAKANIKSNLASETVKSASDKLYRTQQTYFTNIEYLHKANTSRAESTEKLGLVRDEIAKLDTEKVTLVCQKLRHNPLEWFGTSALLTKNCHRKQSERSCSIVCHISLH
jgi:hypothetical protein